MIYIHCGNLRQERQSFDAIFYSIGLWITYSMDPKISFSEKHYYGLQVRNECISSICVFQASLMRPVVSNRAKNTKRITYNLYIIYNNIQNNSFAFIVCIFCTNRNYTFCIHTLSFLLSSENRKHHKNNSSAW